MPYFLQVLEGSETAVSFYKGKVLRIGRGTDVSLRLDSPLVELEHAPGRSPRLARNKVVDLDQPLAPPVL